MPVFPQILSPLVPLHPHSLLPRLFSVASRPWCVTELAALTVVLLLCCCYLCCRIWVPSCSWPPLGRFWQGSCLLSSTKIQILPPQVATPIDASQQQDQRGLAILQQVQETAPRCKRPMSLLSWNCRGSGGSLYNPTLNHLARLITSTKAQVGVEHSQEQLFIICQFSIVTMHRSLLSYSPKLIPNPNLSDLRIGGCLRKTSTP
ncbi:unnamed protein product [Urochloa humidicola]